MPNSYKFEWSFKAVDDSTVGSTEVFNDKAEVEGFRAWGGRQKFLYQDGREDLMDVNIGEQFTMMRHTPILFLKIHWYGLGSDLSDIYFKKLSFDFDFRVTSLTNTTSKFRGIYLHGEDGSFWSAAQYKDSLADIKIVFSNPIIRYFHTINDGQQIMTDEWKDGQSI